MSTRHAVKQIALGMFALVIAGRLLHAQSTPPGTPPGTPPATPPATPSPTTSGDPILVPLAADELEALRPLAARGAAILVRDPDSGARARVTVLVRARAPMSVMHRVISTPEQYTTFMPTITSVDILSRANRRVAFRFHVGAIVFDVSSLSALHEVSDRRVDVSIVQSEIGPGASRWDLIPDGDGTLVALSTWGDPSRGNWLLRQVAQRSPSAIAAMNISTDVLLALASTRRAEILAGLRLPQRPVARAAPPGPLVPPPPGAWLDLARRSTIGVVSLNADGAITQCTVAGGTGATVATVLDRLDDVPHYPDIWRAIREIQPRPAVGAVRGFRMVVQTSLVRNEGDVDRETIRGAGTGTVWWRGRSGHFVGHEHRWDVQTAPGGGSVVMLTGGSESNRTSWITRAMLDRDSWLLPGFAASWKLIWLRPLLALP